MRGSPWIVLLLLAFLGACDQNDRRRPVRDPQLDWGPGSSILYRPAMGDGSAEDWVFCEDTACDSFEELGLRLGADLSVQLLYVPEIEDLGIERAEYCHLAQSVGRYQSFADVLILELEVERGERITVYWEATGELAELSVWGEGGDRSRAWARRLSSINHRGPCPEDSGFGPF